MTYFNSPIKKESKRLGIILIIFLLFINYVESKTDPLNMIAVTNKVEVNPKETFYIDVYFPGIANVTKLEEFKGGFYSDPSLTVEKFRFLGEWNESADRIPPDPNTYRILFVANPDILDKMSQIVLGEYPWGLTYADSGLPKKSENDPPFSILLRAKGDINPGDHKIKIVAIYKSNGEWFFTEDSVNIHVNDWYEENEELIVNFNVHNQVLTAIVGILTFIVALLSLDRFLPEKEVKKEGENNINSIWDIKMMKKEQIHLYLEKLKSEKEDIKFDMGKVLDYFLGGIVFLGTAGLMVTIAVEGVLARGLTSAFFIFLIIIMYLRYFRPSLKKYGNEYNEKRRLTKELYLKLSENKLK